MVMEEEILTLRKYTQRYLGIMRLQQYHNLVSNVSGKTCINIYMYLFINLPIDRKECTNLAKWGKLAKL